MGFPESCWPRDLGGVVGQFLGMEFRHETCQVTCSKNSHLSRNGLLVENWPVTQGESNGGVFGPMHLRGRLVQG